MKHVLFLLAIFIALVSCTTAPTEVDVQNNVYLKITSFAQTQTAKPSPKKTVRPTKTAVAEPLSEKIIGHWRRKGTEGELIKFFPLDNSGVGIISASVRDLDKLTTVYGTYKFVGKDSISVLWEDFSSPEIHKLELLGAGNDLIIQAGNIPWEYFKVK